VTESVVFLARGGRRLYAGKEGRTFGATSEGEGRASRNGHLPFPVEKGGEGKVKRDAWHRPVGTKNRRMTFAAVKKETSFSFTERGEGKNDPRSWGKKYHQKKRKEGGGS